MQQKRPDWFPEGLWVLMMIGLTLLALWPLKVWVIEPAVTAAVPVLGDWSYPVLFVTIAGIIAFAAYRNWRRGLLPSQRRRQEAARRLIDR